MASAEEIFRQVWERYGREVSVSYVGDALEGPWSVMVEGDVGAWAGDTLIDALRNRLEGGPPERTAGWGVDAV